MTVLVSFQISKFRVHALPLHLFVAVEPRYSDPLAGAPSLFQQRLMELAALEAETVRWEKAKKVKKKSKQDS